MIMADGQSLENIGVIPDEKILPAPADIVQGRDPILARAAELAGIKMTAEEAGKVFPFKWPKERMPEFD
jgi:C-terminal processing protease CtpA/Prc